MNQIIKHLPGAYMLNNNSSNNSYNDLNSKQWTEGYLSGAYGNVLPQYPPKHW